MSTHMQKLSTTFKTTTAAALTVFTTLGQPAIALAAEPSSILQAGTYVEGLSYKRYTEPFVLQQLTERTYMVSVSTHNSIFYVSETGVLVFDPLAYGYGQGVLDAIDSVTDLPVTALVYSHFHMDHLGDAQLFVDAAKEDGADLRIIASGEVADQIQSYGNPIPAPTDVIKESLESFTFGELDVRVEATEDTHSIDNTLFLLEQERVLHYLDTVEPEGFLPYFRLVGILDIAPMEETLRYVKTLDWDYLNAGHGNVGSRSDIDAHLDLISDIRNATGAAMSQVPCDQFIDPATDVMFWVKSFHDTIAEKALETLRGKYGDQPRFDAVMTSHVELMISNLSYFYAH